MMKMKLILFLFALLGFSALVSGQQILPGQVLLPCKGAAGEIPGQNCTADGSLYVGSPPPINSDSHHSSATSVAGVAGALGLAGALAVIF